MERRVRFVWWAVLVVLIGVAIWQFFLPHGSKAYLQKSSNNREIVVYVAGAVERPGLIHLPLESRLDDALKQARPLPQANLELLNPAERLKDGQKISIPYKPVPTSPANSAANPAEPSNQMGMNKVPPADVNVNWNLQGPGSNLDNLSNHKININTAGIGELDKLPGIGPALAERIIQYRNEHGLFQRPEDLKNVSGIGEKTYEKMASMITIGP